MDWDTGNGLGEDLRKITIPKRNGNEQIYSRVLKELANEIVMH